MSSDIVFLLFFLFFGNHLLSPEDFQWYTITPYLESIRLTRFYRTYRLSFIIEYFHVPRVEFKAFIYDISSHVIGGWQMAFSRKAFSIRPILSITIHFAAIIFRRFTA